MIFYSTGVFLGTVSHNLEIFVKPYQYQLLSVLLANNQGFDRDLGVLYVCYHYSSV